MLFCFLCQVLVYNILPYIGKRLHNVYIYPYGDCLYIRLFFHPNPFYNFTNLSFSLPKTTDVKICIYNVKGHKIVTLLSEVMVKGNYNVSWDGTDENGKKISSGIYFYTLKTINDIYTKKVILLK